MLAARRSARTPALQAQRCRAHPAWAASPAVRAWRTCAAVSEHGRGGPMPCAAGQASWAGTAPSPGRAMPLSQGHDRSSLSPAGTACAPLACSQEIVMSECQGTRPTRRCQHHFYGPAWREDGKTPSSANGDGVGRGDCPASCPPTEPRLASGEDTPRLGSACGPPRCAAARAARRGEADCYGRKRLGKRASRPMSTATADAILW
jgi:hypothetical protein